MGELEAGGVFGQAWLLTARDNRVALASLRSGLSGLHEFGVPPVLVVLRF
jgi:hypothetical protein